MSRALWALVVVIALGGCDDDEGEMDAGRDAGGVEEDGGARDGGAGDGGLRDGGLRDAGPTDAGSADATVRDGGEDSPDASSIDASVGDCAPGQVVVEESCPPFSACGGELSAGDYCYEGLCIEEEEFLAALLPFCATIEVVAVSGSVTGRVSLLGADELERVSRSLVEVTTLFPENCVVNGCGEVQLLIEREMEGVTASCTMTDECRCVIALENRVESRESFMANAAAGTLRVGSGATQRMYDYCVEDDGAVRFRERAGEEAEPGIQSIAPEP